jgi:oxygen-dependent protoporphyrinogen oxidase
VPRGDAAGESVAAFVSRRLGREALDALVAPFLVGVYAGDERRLGAEAVFPAWVGFERARGSILRGALSAARDRGRPRGLSGSWSLREGLGALARALAERLGERLALRAPVEALAPDGAAFRLECGGARLGVVSARAVVLAVPAHGAAALVRSLDAELAEGLGGIEYAPLATVAVGVDPAASPAPIRGFGFLVPRAAGLDLLGALFTSRVFPGRAPEGRELLTCMLGGARWRGATEAPDDALDARIAQGLERALGLRSAPETVRRTRWPRAVPQPGTDHLRHVARLRALAARAGPLCLAGGYLDGIAVSDALASGVRAAEELDASMRTNRGRC